jgi:hypothetical protein
MYREALQGKAAQQKTKCDFTHDFLCFVVYKI